MEAVHVQLSDKGGIIVMLEKFGDKLLRKFVFIFHDERIAIIRPPDEVGVLPIIQETESMSAP